MSTLKTLTSTFLMAGLATITIGSAAVAGEYSAEIARGGTELTASLGLRTFEVGTADVSAFDFSLAARDGEDPDLQSGIALTFGENGQLSADLTYDGTTDELTYSLSGGITDTVTDFGLLSLVGEVTDHYAGGSLTLKDASVFGLYDAELDAGLRVDYAGSKELRLSIKGKTANGMDVSGSVNFDTADPKNAELGLKISGSF